MQTESQFTKYFSRDKITEYGLMFLTLAAFTLSYDAIRQLAVNSGINHWLSWLYPLTLDAVAIIAALYILKMARAGDGTMYAWLLTVGFAVLSTVFNVLHLDTGAWWYTAYVLPWLPYVVFSVPPVALILSFHLYVLQQERADKRTVLTPTPAPVVTPIDNPAPVVNQPVTTPAPTGDKAARHAALLSFLGDNPAATLTEAAQVVDVSRQTVGKYVSELTEAGALHRNGNGWEVR